MLTNLTQARKAADEILERMVTDGTMTADVARVMATEGFRSAARVLSELRRTGVSAEYITEAFGRQLHRGQEAGDQQAVNAAEFTLAVWGGMLADLAEYLKGNGAQQR